MDEKRKRIRRAIQSTDARLPEATFWWLVAQKAGLTAFEICAFLATTPNDLRVTTKH